MTKDTEQLIKIFVYGARANCWFGMLKKESVEMSDKKNMEINISGGQINVASGNATINATQNNGVSVNELDCIIEGITNNLSELEKDNADAIIDVIEMAKEELVKPEPKASRLKNCLTLLAPMFTIANGIPMLANNLRKLQEFILQCIK